MGRHLDRGHEIARLHDLPVEHREDLERIEPVEPLELGDLDVDHARGRGDEVEAALVGPTHVEVRARNGLREADGGLVLVQLAGLGHDDRDRRSQVRGGQGEQVIRAETAALAPAAPADGQVTGQHASGEAAGHASTRGDPLDAHPGCRRDPG